MKPVPILPTLVTLGNAFCGFLAISYATRAWKFVELRRFCGCGYAISKSCWSILYVTKLFSVLIWPVNVPLL